MTESLPLSILDLAHVAEGSSVRDALLRSQAIAQTAEQAGFTRYWLAEHHGMRAVASAATAVLLSSVGAVTNRIRIGSGGVMLPNHAPLIIAEQFGTLESLYPGRIDLGLGRAPGTDGSTAYALRRNQNMADNFPRDVVELMGLLGDAVPGQPVRAVPGTGTHVPVYILGSSLFGAELAAQLGLPYAFASHFAPAALDQAREIYRSHFQPSAACEKPYFILAVNAFGAESAEAAIRLKSSMQLAFARLRTGQPGPLPRPVDDIAAVLDPAILRMVNQALSVAVHGPVAQVETELRALIERHRPDEIMFNGNIHDQDARRQSFTIAAEAMERIAAGVAA